MGSDGIKRRIQLTGFQNDEKNALTELILKLDCVFFDTEQYRNCTHLIAKKPCKSEKFLATCAAGKWILTKDYIINSAKNGRWLDETTYEWGYKIEKDSHYSPRMQSAPKRWREELTRSGAPGAFHRWKVVLLVAKGDKRRDSFTRVLEAGNATIYTPQNVPKVITHVITNNTKLMTEKEKHLFEVPYYPVRYLGIYLLEVSGWLNRPYASFKYVLYLVQDEIQSNTEDVQVNQLLGEKKAKDPMLDMQLVEMKNALIKHMYFQQVKNRGFSRDLMNILEKLIGDHLFRVAMEEVFLDKYIIPPVQFFHTLLEHILQVRTKDLFFHILYTLLEFDPPWKSSSMLRYYLEVLQCPVCMRGTWSLLEMLVRSCLYNESSCHSVTVSEKLNEDLTFRKTLLEFFFSLLQAEVQHLQVMLQTVLLKTFWLENESSVLCTKRIRILVDWVIKSHREKCKTKDVFKHEVSDLLHGILGTVVEYWILSGFVMDKNVLHHVAVDLASYIAISCDDFSTKELKMFISSIPSLWLEMFVAEAVFTNSCLQNNITISAEPLSLQKIVNSYLPALGNVNMRETGKVQKVKKKKIGHWPCPESQRALLMLNGDKQNQAEVLPDLPKLAFDKCPPLSKKLRNKAEAEMSQTKENFHSPINYKTNIKGETALHTACIRNKVERLIQLLSFPGTDINVKDYAGWTPLHEACNHGSTVCVREILQRCPEVDLLSQVDGVTPLHDALSNGHLEIAELLLQHGGTVLLHQRDSEGKSPLDYVKSLTTKQKLLHVVQPEETVENFSAHMEKHFQSQQIELWTNLFSKMLLNFCSVYNLFTPFPSTLRKVACSSLFPQMNIDGYKGNTRSRTDWLIDLYVREIETFKKLPDSLQEIIEGLKNCSEDQAQAYLAAMEEIAMAVQISSLPLTENYD
uniref:SMC5-SMC6 complex localization factor 1 n=1 Tax=Sphenodon punctatus TaxID=8508 RepID=A0A8D0GUV7_SPHPU